MQSIKQISGLLIDPKISRTRDEMALVTWATYNKVPYRQALTHEDLTQGWLPVGTVRFVENTIFSVAGLNKMGKVRRVKPDYYPDFLKDYLHRQVYLSDNTDSGPRFVKPAYGYKDFDGYIAEKGKQLDQVCWLSDIIECGFDEEWRYYITDGKCVMAEWYKGKTDIPCPAPELNINWPERYCGAVDFGIANGKVTLIEAHHPFSCGYYGEMNPNEIEKYINWLRAGFRYMVFGVAMGGNRN